MRPAYVPRVLSDLNKPTDAIIQQMQKPFTADIANFPADDFFKYKPVR